MIIDWDDPTVQRVLPEEISVSAISLVELTTGPILASTITEQSKRQARLQQVEATFEPIPFDADAARSFGQVVAAVASTGCTHRSRMADLLIAATAHANNLTLYTRSPADFLGLEELIRVVAI